MIEEEAEVVSEAVKVALHQLMEISQDSEFMPEDRLVAIGMILDFAKESFPPEEEEPSEEENEQELAEETEDEQD